jgi:hypothetical protein
VTAGLRELFPCSLLGSVDGIGLLSNGLMQPFSRIENPRIFRLRHRGFFEKAGRSPAGQRRTTHRNKKGIPPTNVSEFPSTRFLLINMMITNVPSATPTTSSNPTDESCKGSFHIRMHWQPGLFCCFVVLLYLLRLVFSS